MNKHEEKYKNDVKENEKSGENRGCGAKNRGFGHSKKRRIPCGCTSLNPTKSTTQKVDENKNYYPF